MLGVAGIVLSSTGAGPLYAFLGIVIAGGLVLYLLTRHTSDSLDAASYPDDPTVPTAPAHPTPATPDRQPRVGCARSGRDRSAERAPALMSRRRPAPGLIYSGRPDRA